jgi:hypothetical protein
VNPFHNPLRSALSLGGRVFPSAFWREWTRRARNAGFRKLFLALSFDCDTPEDASAALELNRRMMDLGIKTTYAVPGAILEKEVGIYARLYAAGAEFLNHGYAQHTYWDVGKKRYASSFFYDKLSEEEIQDDIRRGHQAVIATLGEAPRGFRTPHFGTFQKRRELRMLHEFLQTLGYAYSTSTTPYYAYRHGPYYQDSGLREFPVSGIFSRPLAIQDSWGFFAAPNRPYRPERYLEEAKRMVGFCQKIGMTGILNYYADPSHIVREEYFFKAVELWKTIAEPVQLRDLCLRDSL